MKRFLFSLLSFFVFTSLGFGGYMFFDNYSLVKTDGPNEFEALAVGLTGLSNPACSDNYTSWNSSTTFKANAPWSTTFMNSNPVNPNVSREGASDGGSQKYYMNMTTDLNGDGLPDYMYINHYANTTYNYIDIKDCVYLNNGNGWDKAYSCVATYDSGSIKYYGDCAG